MNIINRVKPEEGGIQKLYLDEIEIPVEGGEEELSLENKDICYFIISGYGTLKVDAYRYALAPQSSVYIPAQNRHWVRNTGAVALKLVRYYTEA